MNFLKPRPRPEKRKVQPHHDVYMRETTRHLFLREIRGDEVYFALGEYEKLKPGNIILFFDTKGHRFLWCEVWEIKKLPNTALKSVKTVIVYGA